MSKATNRFPLEVRERAVRLPATVAKLKDMGIQNLRRQARTNGTSMARSGASRTRRRSLTGRPMPAGQGEPAVPRSGTEHAVGSSFVALSGRAPWTTISLPSPPGGDSSLPPSLGKQPTGLFSDPPHSATPARAASSAGE